MTETEYLTSTHLKIGQINPTTGACVGYTVSIDLVLCILVYSVSFVVTIFNPVYPRQMFFFFFFLLHINFKLFRVGRQNHFAHKLCHRKRKKQ